MKRLSILGAVFLLVGCATRQELAIYDYCEGQGLMKYPQNWISSTTEASVLVGQKVVGSKQVCETDTSTKSAPSGGRSDRTTEVQVRTCRIQDITEPIYERRLVPTTIDTNLALRKNFVSSCFASSKAAGMFNELK